MEGHHTAHGLTNLHGAFVFREHARPLHPFPPAVLYSLLFYFEITVLERGELGRIAIGFSDRTFSNKLTRQPG